MPLPVSGTKLCRADSLDDPGASGFTFGSGRDEFSLVVVKSAGRFFAYRNQCPHAYTPLDFPEDRFLTQDKSHLLCGTHGARFELATGWCSSGPCYGRSLEKVKIAVIDGWITIEGC